MIDIKFIRENKDLIKEGAKKNASRSILTVLLRLMKNAVGFCRNLKT